MSANRPFYITTTLPYVNSDPHIGFAMEIIRADIIARYKKLMGFDVFFNTGTDEHGTKIFRKATEAGITPQAYVDEYAAKFKNLLPALGIGGGAGSAPSAVDVHFIRTTDPAHVAAAQEFWRRCDAAGDIYKKTYKVKYCVGCELEKTESELNDAGRCPLHPGQDLEIIEEENYFFRFSKYQAALLDLYKKNPDFVIPQSRLGEINSFVERGLEDFSISRLASKMPWGVPVPGDAEQVMYVWFDALVSYISTIGWPGKTPDGAENFQKWWVESGGVVQYCGKDNLRQQAAMWQAMLMSARTNSPKLIPSRQIIIDGFITSGGKKMSKSEGNVVDPIALVNEYGPEPLRYYVARELHPFEDSDFTMEKFKGAYNSHLANGLGNLVSRIMKMFTDSGASFKFTLDTTETVLRTRQGGDKYSESFGSYKINEACDFIWNEEIARLNNRIQSEQPFKLIKTDRLRALDIISELVVDLWKIACLLDPIMPVTSQAIKKAISENKLETPLFPRRD